VADKKKNGRWSRRYCLAKRQTKEKRQAIQGGFGGLEFCGGDAGPLGEKKRVDPLKGAESKGSNLRTLVKGKRRGGEGGWILLKGLMRESKEGRREGIPKGGEEIWRDGSISSCKGDFSRGGESKKKKTKKGGRLQGPVANVWGGKNFLYVERMRRMTTLMRATDGVVAKARRGESWNLAVMGIP